MTSRKGGDLKHIGSALPELMEKIESQTRIEPRNAVKLANSLRERHRKYIEEGALPGETFEQAEKRIMQRDDDTQSSNISTAHEQMEQAKIKSLVRKPPRGEEQRDFFVPCLYEVRNRDNRSVMDVAMFRLSKRDKRAGEKIRYELPDGYVEVSAGADGMASVWDYDLVLMAISHLTESMNLFREGKGDKPGRVFKPHVTEIFKFLRRDAGGKQRTDLVETCKRLSTTHIFMQRIKTGKNGKSVTQSTGESLISRFDIITNNVTKKMEYLEIEIAQWIYQEVTEGKKPDVLTVHPDYFLIDPGIGRFLYRLARRSAGHTEATWLFQTLYERSGSGGTIYKFTENLRKIIATDDLPEYTLREEAGKAGPLLVMTYRKTIT